MYNFHQLLTQTDCISLRNKDYPIKCIRKEIVQAMNLNNSILPVFIIADTFNRVDGSI